ncbi:TPA: hypothetical protein ACQYCS_004625 [Vibrio parahaemolyticus]
MNNEEIEENKKEAAEKPSESHTKTWWKDQFRMKPIVYTFEQCKPMRAASQKRSEAQKKATQKMVLTN